MYDVRGNIRKVLADIPEGVSLCAVSKYHPKEYIEEAYAEGQRIFGESVVQELRQKQPLLPSDIEWHFIGHLQTNKVKYIAPYISLIQSVDSIRLLKEIDRQAEKNNRTIRVLLELHVAEEETKSGLTPDEAMAMLEEGEWRVLSHVEICGIMTMASYTDDEEQIHREFARAHDFFEQAKKKYFATQPSFSIRSYGMSGDYPIALSEGSSLVRVGTTIFGPRVY